MKVFNIFSHLFNHAKNVYDGFWTTRMWCSMITFHTRYTMWLKTLSHSDRRNLWVFLLYVIEVKLREWGTLSDAGKQCVRSTLRYIEIHYGIVEAPLILPKIFVIVFDNMKFEKDSMDFSKTGRYVLSLRHCSTCT